MLEVGPITRATAQRIALWRYEPPYDFYDGSTAEVAVMLDPANGYHEILKDGTLVGYVCVGPDARVAGQPADPGTDDIGWGFRPDLIGRGIASRWLPEVLAQLDELLRAPVQRVVIAAWNERSSAAARRIGFQDPATFTNDSGEWLMLSRSRPSRGRRAPAGS